jgi:hypothetical protein
MLPATTPQQTDCGWPPPFGGRISIFLPERAFQIKKKTEKVKKLAKLRRTT